MDKAIGNLAQAAVRSWLANQAGVKHRSIAQMAAGAAARSWLAHQAKLNGAPPSLALTASPTPQVTPNLSTLFQATASRLNPVDPEVANHIAPAVSCAEQLQGNIVRKLQTSHDRPFFEILLKHEYAALEAEVRALGMLQSGASAASARSAMQAADRLIDLETLRAMQEAHEWEAR